MYAYNPGVGLHGRNSNIFRCLILPAIKEQEVSCMVSNYVFISQWNRTHVYAAIQTSSYITYSFPSGTHVCPDQQTSSDVAQQLNLFFLKSLSLISQYPSLSTSKRAKNLTTTIIMATKEVDSGAVSPMSGS